MTENDGDESGRPVVGRRGWPRWPSMRNEINQSIVQAGRHIDRAGEAQRQEAQARAVQQQDAEESIAERAERKAREKKERRRDWWTDFRSWVALGGLTLSITIAAVAYFVPHKAETPAPVVIERTVMVPAPPVPALPPPGPSSVAPPAPR